MAWSATSSSQSLLPCEVYIVNELVSYCHLTSKSPAHRSLAGDTTIMSLECTTLLKCVDQLHSAIRLDISQFATYLDLNTDEIYRNVLDPSACADQTTRLAHEVMRKVEVDLSSYHKMVNHLRQDKKYSNFVDELDAEYFGIRKLTISAGTFYEKV